MVIPTTAIRRPVASQWSARTHLGRLDRSPDAHRCPLTSTILGGRLVYVCLECGRRSDRPRECLDGAKAA